MNQQSLEECPVVSLANSVRFSRLSPTAVSGSCTALQWVVKEVFTREVICELNNEKAVERKHLRSFAKLLGLTGPVLVPATTEPGLNLPLGFAAQRHQTNNFTLKQQRRREIDSFSRSSQLHHLLNGHRCSVTPNALPCV